MSLQSRIELFTEIKERNRKLERYTEKLHKLFLENSLTRKRNKKGIKKRIAAVTALFNEAALASRSALNINFKAIENHREREFCKINWAIESKRISNILLRFKDVQEKGVAMENESLELQKTIFTENKEGVNRMMGSKNMKKQIKKSKLRQKNLKEILKNIQILVEILSDMQNMVDSNKEVVDAVEVNIKKSEVLSKDGAKNLEDALAYQKRVNAIKRFVYGGFGIVICGILGFSFLFFLPVILF